MYGHADIARSLADIQHMLQNVFAQQFSVYLATSVNIHWREPWTQTLAFDWPR